jgi:hypothetical protein
MRSSASLLSFISGAGALFPLILLSDLSAQTFSEQSLAVLGQPNIDARSASLADIDNDGDLDLLFQAVGTGQRLYRNNLAGSGILTFTNITGTNLSGVGDSWSAAWGDYNGDGLVDVFVGQTNSGASGDVLRNDGGGVFTNTSAVVGLNDPAFHQSVAWNDINNDGRLDLIIAMEGPEKHEIYLQGADGTFTPVGAAVGFQAPVGTKAYGMAIGDTDGDGDLDIYISTCRGDNNIRNNFFQNMFVETGSLSFVDIADTNGTQFMTNSYGAEFHDFDNDGRLDLFMVGADGQPSKIFRNDGNNMFTDVDTITGHPLLSDTGRDFNGGRAIDYDNDGDLDLFFHDHLSGGGKNYGRLHQQRSQQRQSLAVHRSGRTIRQYHRNRIIRLRHAQQRHVRAAYAAPRSEYQRRRVQSKRPARALRAWGGHANRSVTHSLARRYGAVPL